MNKIKTNGIDIGFFGKPWYFILAAALSIPLFAGINSYVNSIGVREDETVSFAATTCFMLGVFAGRYLAQVVLVDAITFPKTLLGVLMLLILACTAWLFFHADFPLPGRVS